MELRKTFVDLAPPALTRAIRRYRARHRPGLSMPAVAGHDDDHPERLAVLPFLTGSVLEVGCGPRKSVATAVAVDLTPGKRPGSWGNAAGRISDADVAADGASLPFRADTFDSLVARHNVEHYVDTLRVLGEWARVLKPGGHVVLVVPDEERYEGRTVELDPTHFHAFTEASMAQLLQAAGYVVVDSRPVIEGWSFMIRAVLPEAPAGP